MIMSINAETELAKIHHQFLIKTVELGIEENFINLVKVIYKKLTANITFNERLKTLPLRSRTRQGCLFTQLLFNLVTEASLLLFI